MSLASWVNQKLSVVSWGAAGACTLSFCSCTTVTTQVLRHETGETLGTKRFRGFAHFETSRLFEPSTTVDNLGVVQKNDVFQGSLVGFQAEGGVLPQLDLQLGANFSSGGGGWRAGAKYMCYRNARFSVAAMLGYGASSGSGTVTYMTTGVPVDVAQTLSATTIDVSAPVSFRINPNYALYSGVMLLRSSISGSYGGTVVSDTSGDLGMNLGVKVTFGMFEGDLEAAYLKVQDPFMGGSRFVPYTGFSFGVVF